MKLKIISDGTIAGTKLVNSETGEAVELVQNIIWKIEADDNYTCTTINILNIDVDITSSDAEIVSVKIEDGNHFLDREDGNIKIISDGSISGTIITDNDNNQKIELIRDLVWTADSVDIGVFADLTKVIL